MLIQFREKIKKLMQMNPSEVRENLAEKQKDIAKGVADGDPKVWHRILMAILMMFVGIILAFTVCVQFLLDMQEERFEKGIPIVQAKANEKLPAGTYRIYGIVHAGDSLDQVQNLTWLVSSYHGGALVAVQAPAGTELPTDVTDPSQFTLTVHPDFTWQFNQVTKKPVAPQSPNATK